MIALGDRWRSRLRRHHPGETPIERQADCGRVERRQWRPGSLLRGARRAFLCLQLGSAIVVDRWRCMPNDATEEEPHTVFVGDGLPVALGGPGLLKLRLVHHYRIAEVPDERGPWKVSTAGYFYALDDSRDREIIAYHWHPGGRSPIRFPHLHVGPA